jgi:bifunctional enzyme CysN/CysC
MEPELLRFTTAGSVDDGKSTLIGRLLHDSNAVYEDHLEALRQVSPDGLELAFLTDGLRAEREQGITIDVAYRYFSTPRRKFIIADTPGHEQYTRNMATGASTAQLAVILLDVRKGVLPQTRRHTYIAWLLGIRQIVVTVNKMDLAGYRQEVFERVREEFGRFAGKLPGSRVHFIPVSALLGDNVVRRSGCMPWYEGDSLLQHLEAVPAGEFASSPALRFPVQHVIRSGGDFRGYAGQIASGRVRPGDEVTVLPSGQTARIQSICTYDGDLETASAPMSVTLCLQGHFDVGRGDMLVGPESLPLVATRVRATLVWMAEKPLATNHPYLVKHTSQRVCAEVVRLVSRLDIQSLGEVEAVDLRLNEIGTVELETHRPLICDPYDEDRTTGSFVLIDPASNHTVALGMIAGAVKDRQARPEANRTGQPGLTVWFTGLSAAGKSTLCQAVYERLWAKGYKVESLDGDLVRRTLNRDLGFSKKDRDENIRRIGFVAELLSRNGVIALVSAISPYRAVRDELRARIGNFVEVYVNAPVAVCEQRDAKGLYARARAGELPAFTGIDDPYEAPLNPEVECRTDLETVPESVEKVLRYLEGRLS